MRTRSEKPYSGTLAGTACDEPFGSEPLGIELEAEMLRAELLPSTCSGPELVEGSRIMPRPTRGLGLIQ
ncbi:MAG: hypothetical protein ISS66_01780 [Desulfobacteraceae bacterium]|nr:hypothetical protein [Desulfobacteraceae bacterium]